MSDPTLSVSQGGTPDTYYIELAFAPSFELVSIVRRFVSQFFEMLLPSPKYVGQLAVAVHELLENAVKFSTKTDTEVRIEMHSVENGRRVVIITRNQANDAEIASLRAYVDEMKGASSPMEFYMELMQRSAGRETGSQLGLGRVHAEADMQMEIDVNEDNIVTLQAHTLISEVPR